MSKEKPMVVARNAHYLKGHASWIYCDNCNKTVGYLCYVTYSYFKFSFVCLCGCTGCVENTYKDNAWRSAPLGELMRSRVNKRYCCANDQSALFSPVPKNLYSYCAEIVCKECNTKYTCQQHFAVTPV